MQGWAKALGQDRQDLAERSKPDKDAFERSERDSRYTRCAVEHVGPLVWRQCEASEARVHVRPLAPLSLARREVGVFSQKNDYAGATWLATVSRWVEHFFLGLRSPFIEWSPEGQRRDGGDQNRRRALVVAPHNEVARGSRSRRDAARRWVGRSAVSQDSGPTPLCRAVVRTRRMGRGRHVVLVTYFHGLGAPRPGAGPTVGRERYGTPRVGAGKRGDEASEPGSAVETVVALRSSGCRFFGYRATAFRAARGSAVVSWLGTCA